MPPRATAPRAERPIARIRPDAAVMWPLLALYTTLGLMAANLTDLLFLGGRVSGGINTFSLMIGAASLLLPMVWQGVGSLRDVWLLTDRAIYHNGRPMIALTDITAIRVWHTHISLRTGQTPMHLNYLNNPAAVAREIRATLAGER
ncbi:hypothetical protein [Roseicitreum antarcticum]|uniref:Uncharacterized protein n=1 Tax=Roseicitreum antarcticum TaxID=564137 RepID=A0A1H2RJJ7_9RHOB|nr:hypothetical protein [Roseicitreum antarcticum]SDW19537.1 hypothetical protein SAMN04488238_101337 [Roseicitreum antarcticum]